MKLPSEFCLKQQQNFSIFFFYFSSAYEYTIMNSNSGTDLCGPHFYQRLLSKKFPDKKKLKYEGEAVILIF